MEVGPRVAVFSGEAGRDQIPGQPLFTTFYANTLDGEWFLQSLPGRFLCFTLIYQVSPEKPSNIHAIYHRDLATRRW